jgi:predicted N-formylglutamate amidohydrolase
MIRHARPSSMEKPTRPAKTLPAGNACRSPETNPSRGGNGAFPDFYLITCEHGGNRIPPRYLPLFHGRAALLRTHCGYDMGALRMAREFADLLSAPLLVSTVSRLLIDLNRSPGHPKLFSEATRPAPQEIRQQIFEHYYLPYRSRAEALIEQALASGVRVVHLSCHSFTPELDGKERNADIGLLYDPARPGEAALCRQWKAALNSHASGFRTRLNYPYTGISDGFTAYLRRRFPAERYVGIELELNQKHVRHAHWRLLRSAVLRTFAERSGNAATA